VAIQLRFYLDPMAPSHCFSFLDPFFLRKVGLAYCRMGPDDRSMSTFWRSVPEAFSPTSRFFFTLYELFFCFLPNISSPRDFSR